MVMRNYRTNQQRFRFEEYLWLDSNVQLNSTMPIEFGQLVSLIQVDAYGTSIIGPVPSALCALTNATLQVLMVDCDISCSCCPSCF